jgi:GxxExxY protein
VGSLKANRTLYPLRKAAREIHAELGPGLEKSRYLDALAAKFEGGPWHFERDVEVPLTERAAPRYHKNSVKADFTFKYRKVLVRVMVEPRLVSHIDRSRHMQRMEDLGIPLGLILNFGLPELDYGRLLHVELLRQWRDEHWAFAAELQNAMEEQEAYPAFQETVQPWYKPKAS